MDTKLTVNSLGIDVATRDVKKLIGKLSRLKTTDSVVNGGMYLMGKNYSQIHIDTLMTENQLDDWLYTVDHGADYVGVFVRKI